VANRSTKIRTNGDLRGTPHVRLLGAHGEDLGEMSLAHALRAAMATGLDLVFFSARQSSIVSSRVAAKRSIAARWVAWSWAREETRM
jgi:translation initiation factor IF-3